MGMTTKFTAAPNIELEVATARRRGLLKGGKTLLALSDAGAPTEDGEPRHGEHGVSTGFVKIAPGGDGDDTVAIGYEAYWMVFQHENLEYQHKDGEHAKFLEMAMLEGEEAALAVIAAEIRAALGG